MRLAAFLGISSLASLGWAQTSSPQNVEKVPDTRRVGINIKVPSFDHARDALYEIVRRHSGTVVEATSEVTEKGRRHGDITFRVPTGELDLALADVRGLGKVAVETSSSTPNAREVESIASRHELPIGNRQRDVSQGGETADHRSQHNSSKAARRRSVSRT